LIQLQVTAGKIFGIFEGVTFADGIFLPFLRCRWRSKPCYTAM